MAELTFARWRLNDPAEGPYRWTKVHATEGGGRFLCGLAVPDYPYMVENDASIPPAAEPCERCRRKAAAQLGVR